MKKLISSTCFAIACAVVPSFAAADSLPGTAAEPSGSAGAAAEEAYLPGPGGGELDPNGPPPLESTGMEDGIGSCKCSSAVGASVEPFSPFLALAASLALLKRRRKPRSPSA